MAVVTRYAMLQFNRSRSTHLKLRSAQKDLPETVLNSEYPPCPSLPRVIERLRMWRPKEHTQARLEQYRFWTCYVIAKTGARISQLILSPEPNICGCSLEFLFYRWREYATGRVSTQAGPTDSRRIPGPNPVFPNLIPPCDTRNSGETCRSEKKQDFRASRHH